MSKFEKTIIVVILAAMIIFAGRMLAVEPYQGFIAEPQQTMLASPIQTKISGSDGEVQLTLLAQYIIEGVVKSKELYLLDYPSQISKYDFALAWGDLNREAIDEYIRYSQSGRWYCYRYSEDSPVSQNYIANHSANVHLIHRDGDILRKIVLAATGSHVRIKGFLVNANFSEASWETSLSRGDTGNGACEIMYVTSFEVLD